MQANTSTYAQKLGHWIAHTSLETLPSAMHEEICEKARGCYLDWLGSAYAGAMHPTAQKYVRLGQRMGGSGDHCIVGHEEKLSLLMAVFVNGALGHIAETDDGHRLSILHPGSVVFPVVQALAPLAKDPAKAFIEGAIAGYELVIRVGEALGKAHYSTWHTTATAGVFGAAAAAAKILGLSAEQCAYALGHAGTQAAGLWQFLEDNCLEAKPFHPGKSAMEGLMAALMAEQNIAGAAHIFEGKCGILAALGRAPVAEKLDLNLGQQYKILESNFKMYPTCGQTHSMIDALDTVLQQHDLKAENISAITVQLYARAMEIAGIAQPQSLEEAKFSIPFCLAHFARHKAIPFEGLGLEHVQDPITQALMQKVQLVFDAEMDAGFPAARPCKVTVTLDDGSQYSAFNAFRKGDPESPASYAELAKKFRQLTCEALSAEQSEAFIAAIHALPNTPSMPCIDKK